jgi:membrane protease YdiL (CAAX protease family)
MDIGYCCFGCGPQYFEAALPFLAILALGVAHRCAWLTVHAPRASLARVWVPWLALPTALLWFLDRGDTGFAYLRSAPLAMSAVMIEVVFALAMAALVILTFIGPLHLLARANPLMSVTHRFAAAAGACEMLWRGVYHITNAVA